jgi:hypothetical protein
MSICAPSLLFMSVIAVQRCVSQCTVGRYQKSPDFFVQGQEQGFVHFIVLNVIFCG